MKLIFMKKEETLLTQFWVKISVTSEFRYYEKKPESCRFNFGQ